MDQVDLSLDRRILVVAGKGGVGKSTFAAAIALNAARAGLKTLLLGSDAREGLSHCLGTSKLVYKTRLVEPNLWATNISGRESLEEFLILKLKVKLLYDQLLKRDLFHYFIAAAPGLEELFILGKMWFLCQPDGSGIKGVQFDRIVFDAPATGHGVSLFKTPQGILDTIRVGPIHHYTKDVLKLLTDPAHTAFHIVTLPEEMPVNEAIELDHTVRHDVGMHRGTTFVNGVYPEVVPAPLAGLWEKVRANPSKLATESGVELDSKVATALVEGAERVLERRRLGDGYLERLRAEIPGPMVQVPYLFDTEPGRPLTDAVAASILEQVGRDALGGPIAANRGASRSGRRR